jgi:anti-sigma B factor antagonist
LTIKPNPIVTDGMLAVRNEQQDGKTCVALRGELDLANASTAERELRTALETNRGQVVVDLSQLEFIDSTGIALIVSILSDPEDAARLSFVPAASTAVNRVLDLTGLSERLPTAGGGAGPAEAEGA